MRGLPLDTNLILDLGARKASLDSILSTFSTRRWRIIQAICTFRRTSHIYWEVVHNILLSFVGCFLSLRARVSLLPFSESARLICSPNIIIKGCGTN